VGIDGCSTEEAKKEAVAHYCKGLEMELNAWKARLYDVLAYDNPSGLQDQIILIKSTMKELDTIVDEMKDVCPSSMSDQEKKIGNKLEDLRVHYSKAMEVIAPGWFGG
jgi:hypothetical protein